MKQVSTGTYFGRPRIVPSREMAPHVYYPIPHTKVMGEIFVMLIKLVPVSFLTLSALQNTSFVRRQLCDNFTAPSSFAFFFVFVCPKNSGARYKRTSDALTARDAYLVL